MLWSNQKQGHDNDIWLPLWQWLQSFLQVLLPVAAGVWTGWDVQQINIQQQLSAVCGQNCREYLNVLNTITYMGA